MKRGSWLIDLHVLCALHQDPRINRILLHANTTWARAQESFERLEKHGLIQDKKLTTKGLEVKHRFKLLSILYPATPPFHR